MRTAAFLACLVLAFALPALAEDPPTAKMEPSSPAMSPAQNPSAPEVLGLPPVAKPLPAEPRTCTAEWFCGDVWIMCNGNMSCTVNWYAGAVTCDGVETICPNRCQATRGCKCGTISCWSHDGDCSSGCCPGFVNCDGDIFTCTEACS